MALSLNSITPMPYQPGTSLRLQVLRSCNNPPFSPSVEAIISETFDITMSPVMDVTIHNKAGLYFRAILKLYDRRFGKHFREISDTHVPQTTADEAVFQSFVRRGEVGRFLRELEGKKKAAMRTEIPLPQAEEFLDGTLGGSERYEAVLWQYCNDFFHCETEAYERLVDLQGKSIPRMYAHVCLSSNVPPDLWDSPLARYFEIKGVVLEFIPGYTLWDIAISPLAPPDPNAWSDIVQSAIDAVNDINSRGVILDDCSPRNVMVDKHSQTPIIIDLAQCWFKDKLIETWRETMEDDQDWDPDADYWKTVENSGNTRDIGATMARILQEERGMKLKVKYPALLHQAP
jgi:hypothetical protein